VLSKLLTVFQEDNGKVSAARVQIAFSLGAFFIVFMLWVGIVGGLFFDLWPWSRFDGAITAGGLGLLSVIFGAGASYAANKWGAKKPPSRKY